MCIRDRVDPGAEFSLAAKRLDRVVNFEKYLLRHVFRFWNELLAQNRNREAKHGSTMSAVSYTHLDVYKRQAEANAKADLLIAQHRRARAANRATDAQSGMSANSKSGTFDRMKKKVAREEAIGGAKAQLLAEDVEDRLAALEKEDRIEQLLAELKTKRGA